MSDNGVLGWRRRLAAAAGDLLLLALAAALAAASFLADNPEVYLFPRILSAAMLALALLQCFFALRGDGTDAAGLRAAWAAARPALPGLAVIVSYVALAEWLGFYVAAAIAFFAIARAGAPQRITRRQAAIGAVVTAAVLAALYGLFAVLLKVQTPAGLLG